MDREPRPPFPSNAKPLGARPETVKLVVEPSQIGVIPETLGTAGILVIVTTTKFEYAEHEKLLIVAVITRR